MLIGAALAVAACGGAPPGPRHLVLVTVDTLRADHVGVYGGPVETPVLDALAAEGVYVDAAFTPLPTTGPAHASLFTGLHPWRHGVLANAVPLDAGPPTLAAWLRERGFTTAAFVASYVLHPRWRFDRGFDTYEFLASRGATWKGEAIERFYARGGAITDRALQWLAAHPPEADGDRLFLWVHYFDPHLPYEPPAAFALDPAHPVNLHGKSVPPGVAGRAELRARIRAYRGEVRYVDAEIGRLLAGLRDAGLWDESLLVVTADHGEGLGDHGALDHGWDLHEEQVQVPLLLRGPGVPARGRLAGFAQLEDLLPTLLTLLGVPAPPGLDGVDLAPWLRGDRAASPRREALGRIKRHADVEELYFRRGPERKWIGRLEEPGRVYRIAEDPEERAPAPGDGPPPALLESLARPGGPEARPPELDAEAREALEALGYLAPRDERPDAPVAGSGRRR